MILATDRDPRFDAARAGFEPMQTLAVDVADAAAVNDAASETLRALGGVDILVNNAGINAPCDRATY